MSLYGNPVLHLCKDNAAILLADFASIKRRMPDTAHPFYLEMVGSLCLTMMYDLFAFHMADRPSVYATERSLYAVKEFMSMLDAGYSRKNRSVAFFCQGYACVAEISFGNSEASYRKKCKLLHKHCYASDGKGDA